MNLIKDGCLRPLEFLCRGLLLIDIAFMCLWVKVVVCFPVCCLSVQSVMHGSGLSVLLFYCVVAWPSR